MKKKSLCGLSVDDLFNLIGPSGFTRVQAVTVLNSIYKKSITEISQIQKTSKILKNYLINNADTGISRPIASEVSIDKTVKYLFRTETGKVFETVYIPDNKRNTVCVSTQSGCRMNCSFCLTGSYGFHGNLLAGEIINQILSIPESAKVTHVVFMGMGEPMDNIENVMKACDILTAGWGLAISPRNITVSTVGITPGIKKFLVNSDCNLTLSLHSPFSAERKSIVPVEKNYPAHQIIEIMRNYPVRKKRRLSVAYVMIKDMNDTDLHLEGLKVLLEGSKIRVNLIPYHQNIIDTQASSTSERILFFKHNLVVAGISASIRKTRGFDIAAACGLLASGLK